MPPQASLVQPLAPVHPRKFCNLGFTLVELLVAITLLVIIIGIVVQITNQTNEIWRSSSSRIQASQEARAGFESMTRKLGQATLNTYYDYYDSNHLQRTPATAASFVPYSYDRASELHFISGQVKSFALSGTSGPITTQTDAVFFQAPLGYSVQYPTLDKALNACGYFLRFDDDAASVPDHVKKSPGYVPRYRFRLMEMTQRTENLGVYDPAVAAANPAHSKDCDWFVNNAVANSRVIAENVIALVLLPKLPNREDDPNGTGKGVSLAPNYNYNSRVPLGAASDPILTGFPGDVFTAYPTTGSPITASRHHQLPPLMRVVMVVIDEASAARIQGKSTVPPPAINLANTDLFKDAKNLDADIRALEDICNAKAGNKTGNTQRLTYRVFNTDIIMREAKWSNN